ncbi:MAG: T9SS type A sorting domain-containing protein [Ignavibacteriae bacterium]|nr:T9SS type A sorting domain-containing protein [Ignavibacteriota bacterium]MCB0723366.1 T9SS type A sorting domain-containing protein [Ignavibacteriota bacterium]MCB9243212.1 T9SS type A sorting domain-containing protein [Ignavibacteriales bacterium]
MKRLLITLIGVLLLTSTISFASESGEPSDAKNVIENFYAKIKLDRVRLYWVINNPEDLKEIRLQTKKSGEANYTDLDAIKFGDFIEKETKDSVSEYVYSYRHKVKENGVYFYKITLINNEGQEIGNEEIKLGISSIPDFELLQNNPNPFNPSTIISYKIFTAGHVSLKVYNLTGKQIAVLVDQTQNPGTYSIEFNTGNFPELSSGIYFYKLQTSYSSDIKKMIFAK